MRLDVQNITTLSSARDNNFFISKLPRLTRRSKHAMPSAVPTRQRPPIHQACLQPMTHSQITHNTKTRQALCRALTFAVHNTPPRPSGLSCNQRKLSLQSTDYPSGKPKPEAGPCFYSLPLSPSHIYNCSCIPSRPPLLPLAMCKEFAIPLPIVQHCPKRPPNCSPSYLHAATEGHHPTLRPLTTRPA